MKTIVFCSFVLLLSFGQSSYGSPEATTASSEYLRIRLSKSESQLAVSGLGLKFGTAGNMRLLSLLPSAGRLQIQSQNGVFFLKIVGQSTEILHKGRLNIAGENLLMNGDPTIGELQLVPGIGRNFQVIARVKVDDYLLGVLPSEMPASWPLEALRAQAVASRSYALALKRERLGMPFDLETTVEDQVFNIKNFRRASLSAQEKIREAVESTRDLILTDSKGKALKTYFHAHCGGKTASSRSVWGNHGQSKVVDDQLCALDRGNAWSLQVSADEILRAVFADSFIHFESVGSKALASMRIWSEIAGTEQKVVVEVKGERKEIPADEFRRRMGYSRVKSVNFSAQVKGHQVTFFGKGNGHGVGMCQTGARFMALAGAPFSQILERYYGLELKVPASPELDLEAQSVAKASSAKVDL